MNTAPHRETAAIMLAGFFAVAAVQISILPAKPSTSTFAAAVYSVGAGSFTSSAACGTASSSFGAGINLTKRKRESLLNGIAKRKFN